MNIGNPVYYERLYSRIGRRDKYSYFSERLGYASDSCSTTNHDSHRLRRKGLSPVFSVKKIEGLQSIIRNNVPIIFPFLHIRGTSNRACVTTINNI
jgi:hypothetical protein